MALHTLYQRIMARKIGEGRPEHAEQCVDVCVCVEYSGSRPSALILNANPNPEISGGVIG